MTSTGLEPVTSQYRWNVGSWSFAGSNDPVRNESEVIHEIFHIFNWDFNVVQNVASFKFAN